VIEEHRHFNVQWANAQQFRVCCLLILLVKNQTKIPTWSRDEVQPTFHKFSILFFYGQYYLQTIFDGQVMIPIQDKDFKKKISKVIKLETT